MQRTSTSTELGCAAPLMRLFSIELSRSSHAAMRLWRAHRSGDREGGDMQVTILQLRGE